jgi:DNA-binding response OmpR family regulator
MSARILIIDDERDVARLMQLTLDKSGYETTCAYTGLEGLRRLEEFKPQLVILDIGMPRMDGFEVCQRIRLHSRVPIMILTAHAVTEEQIAHGLNLGADEYMIKPPRMAEFQARVRALLRRARITQDEERPVPNYEDGYLVINITARRVLRNGEEIELTPTEFKLLVTFLQHSGEVLTFQQLLERVWGTEYTTEHHYPRIYVSHLRRKIEPDPKIPTYIHNEYGVGYRFVKQN